jgi:hypothetical protein
MVRAALGAAAMAVIGHGAAGQMSGPNTTGNELFEACADTTNLASQGFCVGYVVGAIEGMKWGAGLPFMAQGAAVGDVNTGAEALLRFCLPEGATLGQYLAVIVNYLQSKPQSRHNSARLLAHLALVEAFPCPAR